MDFPHLSQFIHVYPRVFPVLFVLRRESNPQLGILSGAQWGNQVEWLSSGTRNRFEQGGFCRYNFDEDIIWNCGKLQWYIDSCIYGCLWKICLEVGLQTNIELGGPTIIEFVGCGWRNNAYKHRGLHLKFHFNTIVQIDANWSLATSGILGKLASKSIALFLFGSLTPAISMARPVLKSPNNGNITRFHFSWLHDNVV